MIKNFLEVETVEEANEVDMKEYRWSERFSSAKGKYCFVLRADEMKKK